MNPIEAMNKLPVIVRGPSQSVAVDLKVSHLQGKPWTTWLADYTRLVGENQALEREKAALQAQLKKMAGKKAQKGKKARA